MLRSCPWVALLDIRMPRTGSIVAVIPAYNAEPFVASVIKEASKHVPVIAVNDGSKDGTLDVLRTTSAHVVDQQPNQGKGVALQAGFRTALEQGAAAVIQLDADGQHDPA